MPPPESITTAEIDMRHPARSPLSLMTALLILGIVCRLGVFVAASPFNPDTHYEVIQYIASHWSLPVSNLLGQSYHPPLYHLLMAPLEYLWHSPRPIQFASFLISSVNLVIIWRLLQHPLVMPLKIASPIALAAASVLPQYVMFGNFVSNDTLAILIGTSIFLAALRYVEQPTFARVVLFAAAIGAGLLTKGTFLLTGASMAIPVLVIELRKNTRQRAVLIVLTFCLLWATIGCYKYLDNYRHFGRFFLHNLDAHPEIVEWQKGTWKGWLTLYDINVLKLVRRPILKINDTSSYPLLFYATFWYPHYPDSSFHGNITGYQWLGSVIYALAIVPTLIFLIGLVRSVVAFANVGEQRYQIIIVSLLLLASNFIVVLAAAIKFDAWPNFQSRLCFQSFLPILVIFGLGMETVRKFGAVRVFIQTTCWLIATCSILYFLIEFGLVAGVILPGTEVSP